MNENREELEERISYLENKILELEQKNLSYAKERDSIFQAIRNISDINNQVLVHISGMINDQSVLDMNQKITKAKCDNLGYELLDSRIRGSYFFPVIRSAEETIEEIIQNGKSIARFGDGEFAQIVKMERHKFQKLDDKLALRLEEVLHSHHPNMLIAIADNYGTLQDYAESAANAIRFYMVGGETRRQHMELLERDRIYYNAYVSRPYVMYKDSMTDAPKKRFEHLKKIWDNRNLMIVEGAQTRMGVGNDLLDNAKDIKCILAPATNSFDRYDDIWKAALEYAKEDTLFLIAIGPSAGVLAYDLTVEGYQALDIGHLDLEYEWFLAGKGQRTPIPYKYNNEVEGGDAVEQLRDPAYEGQIVASCV